MKSLYDGILSALKDLGARTALVAMLATPVAMPAAAQVDTIHTTRSLFTWRDGVLAAGFVAATVAIRPLDKRVETIMQDPNRQQRKVFQIAATIVRDVAQPGSYLIGATMYGVGMLSHDKRVAEVGLHGTEALAAGALFADGLKFTFGRARPYVDSTPNPNDWQLFRGTKGGNYQSFPSGHTTAAFAAAAAVSAETSRWIPGLTYFLIGPVMYGGATAVGLSRMYNNRHWASDVIVGAAIGTFAGNKVVRYHRTHPGNPIDKALLNIGWSPGHGMTLGIVR